MRLSFRLKTILGVALIEAVLLLLLVLGNGDFLRRSFDEELNKRAEATLRLFVASSQDAVIATDLATLESAVSGLMRTPGMVYVRVYGHGELLSQGGVRGDGPFIRDYHIDEVEDGVFDTAAEITVDDFHFGRVEMGLEVDAIAGMLDRAQRHNIVLAASEILLVALFSAILGGYLTRQLRSLTEASHAIAEGRIDTLIPVRGRDELAETARAFNRMSAQLQATYGELQQAATFFENTAEAIMITDADNVIVGVNPAFCRITGYDEREVLGRDPGMLSSGRHDEAFYRHMKESLEHEGRWQGEIWNRRKDGEIYAEWLSIVAIKDDAGELAQYMSLFSDITKRKQDEERIWRQANYDTLTGLPNRTLFMDRLDQSLHRAHRERCRFALMFIDLDRFKWVNDTLGHGAGDALLQEASARLRDSVRESDTVARLGGDEFTVILPKIRRDQDAELIAEKILDQLQQPFLLEGREVFISGSVGITLYPDDAGDIETLVRNADAAMYRAKEAGRNAFRFYTQSMNDSAQRRMQLEAELRKAISAQRLDIYYQPIIDLVTGATVGAEALLRWNHLELGRISPDEFIPLAEELGLIAELEAWVLRQACREAAEWPGAPFISVNLSGVQLREGAYPAFVEEVLHESGLEASRLKLEITERLMIDGGDAVIEQFRRLREMGVSIAIDDFGTGYSSLSYLRRFPVNVLKIDRSFVSDLSDAEADGVTLVNTMIAMAQSLNMAVVAEGIEEAAQAELLQRLGAGMGQGFLYSPAVDAKAFLDFLGDGARV